MKKHEVERLINLKFEPLLNQIREINNSHCFQVDLMIKGVRQKVDKIREVYQNYP